MMEDGIKMNCPHCGKLLAVFVRVFVRMSIFKPEKKLKKILRNLSNASGILKITTGNFICPECHKAIWWFLDLPIEVRSPPLSEFGLEQPSLKRKQEKEKRKQTDRNVSVS